jgi:hypothetical protein
VFHELSTATGRLILGHAYIKNFIIGRRGGALLKHNVHTNIHANQPVDSEVTLTERHTESMVI